MQSSRETIGRIARILGVERSILYDLASRAEHLYTHRARVTGRKRRVISSPNGELKLIQQKLLRSVLLSLPISDAAYAVRGKGPIEHAARHLGKAYVLNLDVAMCFPSTGVRMVVSALQRAGFDDDAAALTARLITVKGGLPQGAPTSSAMLEVVFYHLDQELSALALTYGADYSRYVDDLCFSGPAELDRLARDASKAVRRCGYMLNRRKQRQSGPGGPHTITGIVVADDLRPTREFLNKLRRDLGDGSLRTSGKAKSLRGRLGWVETLRRESKRTPREGL